MSYRTLEERFLADYERLETENAELRKKLEETLAEMADKRTNIVLDNAVRKAGREKLFRDCTWACRSDMKDGFDAWCLDRTYVPPQGVSKGEFIEYFADEFEQLWEQEYDGE
jgi:hypothetical protein